jgi:hypothetical protein
MFMAINYSIAQSPDWLWAISAEGRYNNSGEKVVTDASGNVYVTGNFEGPMAIFGSDTLVNKTPGFSDMFLVKYDGGGNVLWARSAHGDDADGGYSVALDASGNAYVSGFFMSDTITFGSYILHSLYDSDVFLVKYDINGNVLWAKQGRGYGEEAGVDVVVDRSGNIYMTGYFYGSSISFESVTLTTNGILDMFLVKYRSNGSVVWAKSGGWCDRLAGNSIGVDSSGNVYVSGSYKESKTSIPHRAGKREIGDMFLVKYDPDGNIIWKRGVEGTELILGVFVAVDPTGNAYVTGRFETPTVTFGQYTLTNTGHTDIFFVKYDSSGNVIWAKSAGGTNHDAGTSIALDGSGNAFLAGTFSSSTILFDSVTLSTNGYDDLFITKYNANGDVQWAKSAGGTGEEWVYSVGLDAFGDIYLTGSFTSPSLSFGSYILPGPDDINVYIYLAKLKGSNAGLNDLAEPNNISVYPNPSNNTLTFGISENKDYRVLIKDIESRVLIDMKLQGSNPAVDVTPLPCGVYFAEVMDGQTVQVKKFVKQ